MRFRPAHTPTKHRVHYVAIVVVIIVAIYRSHCAVGCVRRIRNISEHPAGPVWAEWPGECITRLSSRFNHCFNYIRFYGFDAVGLYWVQPHVCLCVCDTGKARCLYVCSTTPPPTTTNIRSEERTHTHARAAPLHRLQKRHPFGFIYSISSCRWIGVAFTLLICVKYNFDFGFCPIVWL